ncbi:NADH-quinone oxidoreductase subunit N [Ornithinimicrobium sediminis]|uniref:NADH-quinone oxidoreductase subunit N n=1 Tax=Ornithinimicrobium sediminis TaxID=2904603 RepID=UPI001E617A4E|nr:NADH-quinone oxidoreductase subunit N [Ornithinimicrobium sediminis]MCE0487733.1 NADH-quinone oxidoreductase subunit N [Ornithinimicrobium sediminis]
MAMRPALLLPEIVLFLGGLVVLMSGSFLPRTRQWATRVVAATALVTATVLAALALPGPAEMAMEGTFTVDTTTGVARIVVALGTLVVLAMASDEISGTPRESETYALLLFSSTGTLVLAGADDLLVVTVGFLLASIPLYGLIGIARTPLSAEATMKTYLLGALFGILLLAGVTLLYGVSATTSYVELTDRLADAPAAVVGTGVMAVLGGLMFKAGGAPGHFWVPDAAQASGGAVAAFLTTVPKIGAVIAAYRLVSMLPDTVAWPLLVALLAVVSMTLGNLAAYWQTDPRRLLGWSTVSQVGYLLVPVAVAGQSDLALPSLLVYLAGYTVTNLAAFAVTTAFPDRRDLHSYRGMGRAHPWLGAALVVALLGLVGTPPTVVFVGKLTTTAAAWDAGYVWLAVLVLVNTVASLFYYLRWIAPVYAGGEPPGVLTTPRAVTPAAWSASTAVVTAALSVVLGVGAGVLWSLVSV